MGWRERVRQFRAAAAPRFTDADAHFVTLWLTQPERRLFARQSAYEQQHAVALARRVLAGGLPTSRELIAATLLHDVGKTAASLHRWQRVLFVLLAAIPGQPLQRLSPAARGPWRGLWVLQHHPALGAGLARQAGVNDRIAWLIAHHHDPLADQELHRLQAADNGSPPAPV